MRHLKKNIPSLSQKKKKGGPALQLHPLYLPPLSPALRPPIHPKKELRMSKDG